ncbi:28S ribosomal protein S31, mitochondrial-like [Asterias rubens]|uniref:28S ribosomal protein S31, mitochondrial-like n=1 Tax=Asterias rubens TaxID=7604 RepID=UPI001455CB0C|nr:28S ribosomal protein S31, mitochondrial-like [Asterias rubens]
MSRIWRRIPLIYGVKHEPLILARFNISRCVQTTTGRLDSPKENGESNSSESSPKTPPKSHLSADKLLSTLTGLKVMKNLDSKVGRSPRLRSAAADFLQLKEKKADERDSTSDDIQSPEIIKKMVLETVTKVAEIFPEKEVVESDLLKQLRRHDEATEAGQLGDLDAVSSILSGIKVQKQATLRKKVEHTASDERALTEMLGNQFGDDSRRSEKPEPYKRQQMRTLFDRQRLNLFKVSSDKASKTQVLVDPENDVLTLWDKEEKKKLRALSYSTISHGFEEMIKWTEEGKLWHYPINNEQGLEEEQAIGFHEHVFFDHLLEDLPQIEPIINFMELVCVGLSKNPYLTVEQKHEHIEWFKKYFIEREAIIKEALEAEKADEARGMVV